MNDLDAPTWGQIGFRAVLALAVTLVGAAAGSGLWLRDLWAPQVAFLGAGNRLSLLVTDGPARLLLASGDQQTDFENALTSFRPLFARRIDVLLVDGAGATALVPLAAIQSGHARTTYALSPVPPDPGYEALSALPLLPTPRRIQLSPAVRITVELTETRSLGEAVVPAAWRMIIEHGASRVVVLSDGKAASRFPPAAPASVLAVAGGEPDEALEASRGAALVANGEAITGSDLRAALDREERPPAWVARVAPGEALRLRFVDGGVELPADLMEGVPADGAGHATPPPVAAALRRRVPLPPRETRS